MAQQRLLLLRGNTPVVGGEGTPPSVGRALAEVPAFATAATDAMRVSARYQWGSIATRTRFERCMSASGASCLSDHTPTAKVKVGPGVRSFLFGAGVAYAMGKGAKHILLVGAGLAVMTLLDRSAVAAGPVNG
jgi:hypothetical protein